MRVEKTVFISYRRTNMYHAQAVYLALKNAGFDVFIDYQSIDSGAFDQVILNQIAARAHFVVILTPSALERCENPSDWLRREIEEAVDLKRNIIPVMFDQFDFAPVQKYLTGKLSVLSTYNGLAVPPGYFEEAMQRLITRFLDVSLDAVLHPAPPEDHDAVEQRKADADARPAPSEDQMSAEQYFERAYNLHIQGEYEQAITCYDEALRLKPDYAIAYDNRGSVRADMGDYDAAIADHTEAIRLDPQMANAFYNRGSARAFLGDYAAAIADFDETIRLDPHYANAYNNRGWSLGRQENYAAAIADFSEAIRLDPQHADAYNNRGWNLIRRKNYAAALADINEAIRLDPQHADAYTNRALVRYYQDDYDAAIGDCEAALRINPDYRRANELLELARQKKRGGGLRRLFGG